MHVHHHGVYVSIISHASLTVFTSYTILKIFQKLASKCVIIFKTYLIDLSLKNWEQCMESRAVCIMYSVIYFPF